MRRLGVACLGLLAVSGCNPWKALEESARSPTALYARESAGLLLRNDLGTLALRFTPDIDRASMPDALARLQLHVPEGATPEPLLVHFERFRSTKVTRETFTYEYAYPKQHLLVLVVVDSSGPAPLVAGLHVKPMPDSLARVNAFGFSGRRPRHFVMLGSAILAVTLTLVTLVACARTRLPRRKWLWVLLIAVGFGRLDLNWTTGQMGFVPIAFQVLSASFTATGPYAPWIVSVSLPVGAIVFLALRRRLEARTAGERLEAMPSAFE